MTVAVQVQQIPCQGGVSPMQSSTKEESLSDAVVASVWKETRNFYQKHSEIKESHGVGHIEAVYRHAVQALACCRHKNNGGDDDDDDDGSTPNISATQVMEIKIATILHDVDDGKYFPNNSHYENAQSIMNMAQVPVDSHQSILDMIEWVSCSKNGNDVPKSIQESGEYFRLIPRWSDRLEAVGVVGVVRCFQYNAEHGQALSSESSPRAENVDQVWALATPERFAAYQQRGGSSDDMISHYYDKLLHVARPPPCIVRNSYLQSQAEKSSCELVKVCIQFGKTGKVDVDYIQQLAKRLSSVTVSELN
jgi:uncharacterized protein